MAPPACDTGVPITPTGGIGPKLCWPGACARTVEYGRASGAASRTVTTRQWQKSTPNASVHPALGGFETVAHHSRYKASVAQVRLEEAVAGKG